MASLHRRIQLPRTYLALAVVSACVFSGCLGRLPGDDPKYYSVRVDNRLPAGLTFAAEIEHTFKPVFGSVGAGQTGTILVSLGAPKPDDPVFKGQMCTTVDIVALDPAEREAARHPPGLCLGDTWVIGPPSVS